MLYLKNGKLVEIERIHKRFQRILDKLIYSMKYSHYNY